jgi:hypothetical protein
VKCEVLGAKCEVQLKRWLSQAGEQLRAVLVAVRRATEGGEHHCHITASTTTRTRGSSSAMIICLPIIQSNFHHLFL